jgi:DNA-binding Xre family transcriptional regulator
MNQSDNHNQETTVNQRINELIIEKGVMKSKLAAFIGVSDAAIQNWIRRDVEVRQKHLIKMLEFFGDIESTWLFFGTGPKYKGRPDVNSPKEIGGDDMSKCGNCSMCMQKIAIIEELYKMIAMKDKKIEELNREIGTMMNKMDTVKLS